MTSPKDHSRKSWIKTYWKDLLKVILLFGAIIGGLALVARFTGEKISIGG